MLSDELCMILIFFVISEDIADQELRRLWKEYSSSKEGSSTDEYRGMHSIAIALIQTYDSPDETDWRNNCRPGRSSFSSSSVFSTHGHPASFVTELVNQLSQELNHKKSVTEKYLDVSFPASISLARLHPSSNTLNVAKLAESRKYLLDMLRAVSILVRWPQNCAIIMQTFGTSFAKLIMSVAKSICR